MATNDPRKLAQDTAVAAVWLPREDLTRWDRNPRRHTERSLNATRKSIERFGFVAPVIVWIAGDRMVAGHGRLKSFDTLRAENGEDWKPKHAPGVGLVPVRFMQFDSEKDANDYAIVDNRTTELSEWDEDGLVAVANDFDSVHDTLVEMALWEDDELERLLNVPPTRTPPDTFPEFNENNLGTDYTCPKCGHAWSGKPQ